MPPPPTPPGHRLLAMLVLVAVSLAWHVPGIGRPFGPNDVNPGMYFGTYVRNFQRHGFWHLRGVPLMPQVANTPAEATPHLSHPPAFTWISQLLGDSEASFRWPTVVMATLAALCLFELLRPRLGPWPAFGAALFLLGMPGNAVLCQGSFEIPVLGAGMVLLLATDRVLAGQTRWRVVQALATFYGSWSDWGIAFFCLGLLAFCLPKGKAGLRALLVPTVTGVVALALLVLWHKLAFVEQVFGQRPPDSAAWELVRNHALDRPELGRFLAGAWKCLAICLGSFAAIASAFGVVPLLAADWSLCVALALTGFVYPVAFAKHGATHFHVWLTLGPFVAAALAALASSGRWALRAAGLLVLGIAVGSSWAASACVRAEDDTPFFRDLGAFLTAQTLEGTTPAAPNLVLTNFPQNFGYYSPVPAVVVTPVWDPAQIEAIPRQLRVRYLWMRLSGMQWFAPTTSPQLEQYLQRFPWRRVPELETELHYVGEAQPYRIEEARLYVLER